MSLKVKSLVGVLALVLLWMAVAPTLAERLIVEKRIDRADVIFVLSGSAVYRERTRKAASEYKQGVASVVLLSDDGGQAGWNAVEERNPKFVELAKRSLVRQGVSEGSIEVMDAAVAGTYEEAVAFRELALSRGWKSVMLITSAYHTNRALNTFENQLESTGIKVGIASPAVGDYMPPAATWWFSVDGWRYVAGEYLKSAYYWLFY